MQSHSSPLFKQQKMLHGMQEVHAFKVNSYVIIIIFLPIK